MSKPAKPIKRKFKVLWFLYPEIKAYELIGIAKNKIKLWTNSLSIENAKNPEVKIKNDGASKQ